MYDSHSVLMNGWIQSEVLNPRLLRSLIILLGSGNLSELNLASP